MKISSIIPAFNASRFLERAVRSLIKTGYHDLEIVIVEDGSEDSTFKITEELRRQYHDYVVVYQHPKRANLGVSASRNLGILKSTGALICFLDADDVVYPNRFEVSAALLESNLDIDAVYETVLMVFDDDSSKDTMAEWGKTFGLSRKVHPSALLTELLRGRTWHTSGILCRRTLFDKTGLFNTKFRIAEDCNLWFKMASVGRIISGDMSKPVSEYHRHSENTFILSIDRKPDMVSAMVDACRWAQRKRLSGRVLNVIITETRSYILNSVAIALQANRIDLAWEIIKAALKDGGLTIFANLRLIQTIAWLCRKTIHN
jgi:glycosyltransferase involved in cell wall biosynthesis